MPEPCVKIPCRWRRGLRTLILGLYDKRLAPDGRAVDYASLAHDPGFRDYVTAASELTKVE